MYYGKGAGKLPTASAVVSDVIDCARHMGKEIPCFWENEEIELTGTWEAERRFFVRASLDKEEEARSLFGKIEKVEAGIAGEFAFVTDVMKEKEFDEKAKELGIIGRIRMEA